MTNRILYTLFITCISLAGKAHEPDLSTTLLIEQGEGKWLLQIRSSINAFEYEIETHFGASAYSTPEEFRNLVVDYVQSNIRIEVDGKKTARLQNGVVQLGHETNATFEVVGMPKDILSLVVQNSSFSDISKNQSALIVVKKGFTKDQYILNDDNQHTVELAVENTSFQLATPTQGLSQISNGP